MTADALPQVVLANARLADSEQAGGRLVDVEIADGKVAGINPAGTAAVRDAQREDNLQRTDATTHDLGGDLLLCAPAEPHAHIDKAFTADTIANQSGDLHGAISSWQDHYGSPSYDRYQDFDDTVRRASRAVELAISNGICAIRSHANVGELKRSVVAVEALAEVRQLYRHKIDLQIVALIAPSVVGKAGAYGRQQLALALEAGADIVGGAPMLEDKPDQAIAVLMDAATDAGIPVDLHTDETLDPKMLTLLEMCRQVERRGFPHGVVASHCVSLGVQPAKKQQQISRQVAQANIAVITLPQTNLFLQARGQATSAPRGLTAIGPLLGAGAVVAGGGDNLQDPFNLVGQGDALETASLLVAAGHLDPNTSYDLVSRNARTAMGLPVAGIELGARADLLAVDAPNIRAVVAGAVGRRRTFRQGRLLAEKRTEVSLD